MFNHDPMTVDVELLTTGELKECISLLRDDVSIESMLEKRRQIAMIWSIEDVIGIRSDLSEDQAWMVLKTVDRHADCFEGINYKTLEDEAQDLYPEQEDTQC